MCADWYFSRLAVPGPWSKLSTARAKSSRDMASGLVSARPLRPHECPLLAACLSRDVPPGREQMRPPMQRRGRINEALVVSEVLWQCLERFLV